MKAGFLVAGKRGRGLVSCRDEETHEWGAPAHYNMTELSFGLQAGIQNASFVLLVVDAAGVERLLAQRLALGGDVSVAAGPVGAGKQGNLDSSVVSYAHAEGLFAGVQLGGSAITYAKKANAKAYGVELPAKHVLFETRTVPHELKAFQETLMRYAPPPQS
jgi:lipid-binding SYLF domain-containing protein